MAAARVDFQLPPKIITPRNGYFIRPLSGHRRPLFKFHARACVLYRALDKSPFSVSRVRLYTNRFKGILYGDRRVSPAIPTNTGNGLSLRNIIL